MALQIDATIPDIDSFMIAPDHGLRVIIAIIVKNITIEM